MAISSLSASTIPSLNASNFTSNYSSKLPSFSSLQFPAQLRRLQFLNRGVSSHSRPRNLPLVSAKKQTFSTFDELLQNSDKPVLVDFYATWCGPCQFMAPVLNEVSAVLKDTVQVVKIDTEKYPSIADKYKIEALPTFIIFKDGKPYDRFSDNGVHNNIEFPKGCSGSGPRVIVRSIKRIKKGEEVTVAYTDLLQPKEIRQSELWAKYRFICCCTRCGASSPSYVDHILQEISSSNLASSSLSSELSFYRDEATRKLTDYVDEVTAQYLAVGDPEFCCKKLENILITGLLDEQLEAREGKSQLNFRLHSLHHLALNTYTILASAYKIRASDLFALHSEVGGLSLEVLSMSRISAAYSLLLAAATYHLFCFESSLIASVANFWTSAGESLLTLARSSAWDSLGKCGLPVSNLSPLAEHKCSKCSLLESFEANLSLGQDQIRKADFDSISSRFLYCISSLLKKVWGFLIQGSHYLKMFKDPTDFSLLGKSLDMWDFDAQLTHNDVYFNCWTNKNISGIEALGYTDQWRINIFQLGVHCLLYGGFLSGICYGPHSHWTSHIRSTLY